MAVVAVTFNGVRVNDSDSNTNWGNFVVGGGAPASEFPLAYQVTSGTTAGAVNKKINSTSARQGVDYVHGSGQDMTGNNKLWFCKIYVSDSFDLNATWGVEVAMGSADTNNDNRYNIAGTGANLSVYNQYPAQGGYLITSINPAITAWREAVNGTPAYNSILWWAVGAQFINGTAKTENVAMDSIDIGKGLNLVGGDGVSTDGTFVDFVTEDQDDKTNRWGVVTGSGNNVRAHGMLVIGENTSGTAVATGFTDNTSVVVFPDGYHSRGLVGVEVELGSASTVIDIGCLLIGEGTRNGVDANDTRPDLLVTGTSGTLALGAQMRNFRDVTLTSAVTVEGADIECHLLVQSSCDIFDSLIRTNSLSAVACLQDPTFGTTTDLRDTEFRQVGAGHAIEINAAGTYNLQGLVFTDYGITTANDAALFINVASGTVNINISGGGSTPTYRLPGGSTATVNINNTVTLTVTVVDSNNNPIEGARVRIENQSTGALVSQGTTNASGIYSDASYNYTADLAVTTKVRLKGYKPFRTAGTIESTGLSVGVTMLTDPAVDLP